MELNSVLSNHSQVHERMRAIEAKILGRRWSFHAAADDATANVPIVSTPAFMDPTRTFGRDPDLGGRDNVVIPSCDLLLSEWEAKDAPKGNARLFHIVQEYLQDPQDPRLPGLPVCVHPTNEPSDWKDSMLTDRKVEYGCLASLEAEFAKDRERWADNWARDTVREKLTALNLTDEVPGKWDVLFGRGMRIHKRPGNVRFHHILRDFRDCYKHARRDQKAPIVLEALAAVRNHHSWGAAKIRFLKRAPTNAVDSVEPRQWILASEDEVFEKVRHVLRDPKPVKFATRKKLPTDHQRVLPQEQEHLMNAAGAPIHSRFGRNMPGVYVLVPDSSANFNIHATVNANPLIMIQHAASEAFGREAPSEESGSADGKDNFSGASVNATSIAMSDIEPPMPDLEDESLRLTEEELRYLEWLV